MMLKALYKNKEEEKKKKKKNDSQFEQSNIQ